MSDTSFRAYRTGRQHAAQRKADKIDQPEKSNRASGIFEAINENLKAKDQISYQAQEQRKTAKELAEGYKRGSTKISDDTTVVEGYQDPGFTLPGVQGRSFGGLIGTVGGAVAGSFIPGVGPMMGSQIGGKVGSYF
jgi:hypothetical protein